MFRTTGLALVLAGVIGVSAPARAQDGPYHWGIGPKLGTTFLPGRYPYAFPSKITKYDFLEEGTQAGPEEGENAGRDLDDDGDFRFSTVAPVGVDVRIGGEGFYGIDKYNRLGAGVGLGLGKRHTDVWFNLNYDRVLYSESTFDLVLGGQIGYGFTRWGGDPNLPGGTNESLKMGYYPIRARIAGQFRDKTRMYGLGLFVQDGVPANTTYTDLDGVVQESVGGAGNFLLFFLAGLEIDVQFGDFTPPKKKKPPPKKPAPGGGGAKKPTPNPNPAPKPKPTPPKHP